MPFKQFDAWCQESPQEVMTLATVDALGNPDARIVLLKEVSLEGLVFFTNYHSVKAQELESHPYAACVFFWPALERQVRIRGPVSKISATDSDAYFKIRPRGSQLGAWASDQSKVLKDRAELEAAYAKFEKLYADREVPRPGHWGGYCLKPEHFEFWQGRQDRLHDRFVYHLRETGLWEKTRLAP